jgi:hypothetical protein
MYHRSQSRAGVTLTEVLVAIFVCGLGLMALMTLFPLGAMNMAQAIKDDRCGHAAANATAVLRSVWRVSLESGNMDQNLEAALRQGPVYIDPIGMTVFGGGPVANTGIQRMNLNNASRSQAIRWCSLLDDIDFNPNATPVPAGAEISRQNRFSWAWMVRWLRGAADSKARALEFQVVVYHNRSIGQTAGLTPIGEAPFSATFTAADTAVVAGVPSVKKGGWVMDGQGYFYRVTSANNTGGSVIITVQTPFRNPQGGGGTLVFMDNVAEVFERSTLE